MSPALLKKITPHLLAGTALEQNVVRDHHGGAAVDLQQRVNVLHEIELLIAGGGPEIFAEDDLVVLLRVALLVDEKQALLLAERRIGKDHGICARQGVATWPPPAVP